jgi:conserved oligomeric Golgi complex subunit 1
VPASPAAVNACEALLGQCSNATVSTRHADDNGRGNYRDLLSTADQIVSLDSRTRSAETSISTLGQLCTPNSRKLPPSRGPGSLVIARIPEIWLSERCISAGALSLRSRDFLRAAQLVVITRLLLKSAGESLNSSAIYELFQDKLASLRRQTVQHIDNVLASPRTTISAMVKAACAYCLISSASSIEAMKYAQRLRLDKLRQVLAGDTLTEHFATGILQYLLSTTRTFRRAFSRPLSDALSNIQRRPLLVDIDLTASDIIGSGDMLALISEDIKTFSPYFKRDPITASTLNSSLEEWTEQACQYLAKSLDRQLADMASVRSIVALRSRLYSDLLPSYFSIPASNMIHRTVQQKVGERITEVITSDITKLEEISKELLGSTTADNASLDLWDARFVKMGLGNGAAAFLDQVHKRRHGLTSRTNSLSRTLRLWISRVLQHLTVIEECRQVRWRDLLEQPDEDQEKEASIIIRSLTETDPMDFLSQTNTALQSAIDAFEVEMVRVVRKNQATSFLQCTVFEPSELH